MQMSRPLENWSIRCSLLVLLTYGLFYYAYKFHIPWSAANDFASYYPMYLHPLALNSRAPFVYRQVNALLVHAIWKSGLYYRDAIWFRDPFYDQHVFFAALLANYSALIAACAVVSEIVERHLEGEHLLLPLTGAALCLLSFLTMIHVITGMSEGVTWLFMAILYDLYDRGKLGWLCAVMTVTIFVHETIPMAFVAIALLDKRSIRVAVWSALCFVAYLVVRIWILPVPGHEEQLRPLAMLAILTRFRLTGSFAFQAILSQNILAIYVGAEVFLRLRGRQFSPELLTLGGAFTMLFLVGIAATGGSNAGRICAILTPIISAQAALDLIEIG